MMDGRGRVAQRIVVLGALSFLLIGCESIREAAGITKEPPDEFAVVTKAPLVIPPDFSLKPPKPGAAPTNQVSPTASAQEALYGDNPAVIAAGMNGGFSDEEKIVLAKSGGAIADPGIRQQIEADAKKMEPADESFTDKVLFRGPQTDQGQPVDADAEAQRLSDAKAQGAANGQASANSGQPASPPTTPRPDQDDQSNQKDDGGWLDGILGGIF